MQIPKIKYQQIKYQKIKSQKIRYQKILYQKIRYEINPDTKINTHKIYYVFILQTFFVLFHF